MYTLYPKLCIKSKNKIHNTLSEQLTGYRRNKFQFIKTIQEGIDITREGLGMKNDKNETIEETNAQSIGKLQLGKKNYSVHDEHNKIVFKDTSDQEIKVDFSFSKDKHKNNLAKDGWHAFWTELFK